MSHVVDANVLIEAKKRYYRFGICPGYWDWLGRAHASGEIHSLDVVRQEIMDNPGDDPLKDWVASGPASFFKERNEATVEKFRTIAEWTASKPNYIDAAKNNFLSTDKADAWLVAHALAHNLVLVTDEQSAPESKKRIMIPDVCKEHGVSWLNTFDFLEKQGASFRL